jgi:hypothetical protein
MRLFVIDPGKASGWMCIDFSTGDWMGGEKPHDELVDWLEPADSPSTFENSNSPLILWGINHVLMEGFKVGPKTYQLTPTDKQLWSVKQIGIVEMWCRRLQIPFETQFSSAMDFDADGTKLKAMGWYKPMVGVKGEEGHRRAAAKHALKWGVDHHLIKTETLL